MTEIMVSKRDGIAKGPDGIKYRVARGKTLADARHPLVQAHPGDWTPMRVELSVEGGTTTVGDVEALEELRNDLAELEELAEARGAECLRLVEALTQVSEVVEQAGELPPESEREAGWLAAAVRTALTNAYAKGLEAPGSGEAPQPAEAEQPPTTPDVPAPRPPRAAKRAGRTASDD